MSWYYGCPYGKQTDSNPMVSADQARALTKKARFAASGYASLADSTIREACEKGENSATILVPLEVAEDMVILLCDHGFEEVVITGAITGAMVSVAW